jgi:two-component system cell cycle response regulator
MAVLYLNLHGFKRINDTLGHSAGAAVLTSVARRLKSLVREEDTVARVGGDEFIIALWQIADASDVSIMAAKLKTSFRKATRSKTTRFPSPQA